MRIFLAGCNGRWDIVEEAMRLYLAGCPNERNRAVNLGLKIEGTNYKPYILESFFYMNPDTEALIPRFGDFLLDSGAFTFMQGTKGAVDWDAYVERYSNFIVTNGIEKFFELDIDSVAGYGKVKQIRAQLERATGRQTIPVWHINRGKDDFVGVCKDYAYVAIGGLVGGKAEYSRKYWDRFNWFIDTAHTHGAKIHALGFTSFEGISKYHFDSVDSTAWVAGNRFGYAYSFRNGKMTKVEAPKGRRLNAKKGALHNFTEWCKFQKWAETHL